MGTSAANYAWNLFRSKNRKPSLTLFVTRVPAEDRGFDSELGVGVGLEPDRLGERLTERFVWIGRWTVVDREYALDRFSIRRRLALVAIRYSQERSVATQSRRGRR